MFEARTGRASRLPFKFEGEYILLHNVDNHHGCPRKP
jgi:hypothetical protein